MRAALLCPTLVALAISDVSASAEVLVGVSSAFSGPMAWAGAETMQGAERAAADLNAAGGVLGQEVKLVFVDHFCDAGQAVAAAQKLMAAEVDFVVGLDCSSAAIASSQVFAELGTLIMTSAASNPVLTEQGFANVFRFCGRDDEQGGMAGAYLANQWRDRKVAIVHDGDVYGQGLAEQTKQALNAAGVSEVLFTRIEAGLTDYGDLLDRIQSADADVLYYAGYPEEAGLIVRQLRERGDELQLLGGDALHSDDFGLIAGEAGDGVLFTMFRDGREVPEAADLLAAFRAEGHEPGSGAFLVYGAMQAWAQAVEQAGTVASDAVGDALRTGTFDTIFGRIGFDPKGDVTGYEPFAWYRWHGYDFVPADLTQ